ncbi:hypothetical protein RU98_GL002289 [Enterococcus caccae]|nr:hypothetical protein RU98_GL002289 [Enterococcus caccae]
MQKNAKILFAYLFIVVLLFYIEKFIFTSTVHKLVSPKTEKF